MSKYQPYSRRRLRALARTWARSRGRLIAYVTLGVVTLLAIETTAETVAFSGPFRWYVMGVTHAVLISAGMSMVVMAFLAHDREAIHHVRGAWGEDNTRGELKQARRRRLVWGWVDSINLQVGDIDHLVITRRGGVVAIDSKWRNAVAASDTAEMARSARVASTRAAGVLRSQLAKERGARHRARADSFEVTPVVVVWGAAQHTVPPDAVVDGVRFVAGRELLAWLRSLDGDAIPRQAADDALARLRDFRASAWQPN